jgi:hypothetical protein
VPTSVLRTSGIEPLPIDLVHGRPVIRWVRLKLRAEKIDSLVDQMVPFLTNAFILLEETSERALAVRVNPNQTRLNAERGNCP